MSSVPYDRRSVFAACLEKAAELGALSATRMLARAEKSILDRAAATPDERERRGLAEAAQLLSRYKDPIAATYPELLRREFAAPRENKAPKPQPLSFESLELMAEDKVDETVELLRAQQEVQSSVEAELTELNALISAVQGDRVVRASANPLRAAGWVRALREATLQCAVSPSVRQSWMQLLSEALGPELAAIYRQLSQMLRAQGIAAASYGVNAPATARAAGTPRQSGPAASAHSHAGSHTGSQPQPLLNLRDLRRLLVSDRSKPRAPSSSASTGRPAAEPASDLMDPGVTVPWSFQALQEMNQIDEAVQRMQQRRTAVADHAAAGTATQPVPLTHLTPAQALGQEVVKLMVENVAADARVLAPVQQAVRDLQPALLRLVRSDPRFFNDKQHPTRVLLAEMTQRSLAWSSADAAGFAEFFEPLRQAVDALAGLAIENVDPFEFALQSLRQAWAEQEERTRRERAHAARVLIKAEQRNLAAEKIGAELRSRQDLSTASSEIRRFVLGPWAQVMASAQMADSGSADPQGYGAIINDLIWSTQPRLAGQSPNRLATLVPPLLKALRQGLASIGYPADATQRLMDYLDQQHQLALRRPAPAPAQPTAMTRAELEAQWDSAKDRPEVWLEQSEARDSGLMDLLPETTPAWKDTEPVASEEQPDLGPAAPQPGAWVDVFLQGAWSRWQLTWASPHALMFMFTDGAGKHQSMTRPMLDKMIALGALRIVAQQTVLEGALDAVAEKALRNSVNSTL